MTVRVTSVVSSLRGASFRMHYDVWFPLVVFAATRAVDALLIVAASPHQVALIGRDPSYHLNYPSPPIPGTRSSQPTGTASGTGASPWSATPCTCRWGRTGTCP